MVAFFFNALQEIMLKSHGICIKKMNIEEETYCGNIVENYTFSTIVTYELISNKDNHKIISKDLVCLWKTTNINKIKFFFCYSLLIYYYFSMLYKRKIYSNKTYNICRMETKGHKEHALQMHPFQAAMGSSKCEIQVIPIIEMTT